MAIDPVMKAHRTGLAIGHGHSSGYRVGVKPTHNRALLDRAARIARQLRKFVFATVTGNVESKIHPAIYISRDIALLGAAGNDESRKRDQPNSLHDVSPCLALKASR